MGTEERIKEIGKKFYPVVNPNAEYLKKQEIILNAIEIVNNEQKIFCVIDVYKKLKEQGNDFNKEQIEAVIKRFKPNGVFPDVSDEDIKNIRGEKFKIGRKHFYKLNMDNELLFLSSKIKDSFLKSCGEIGKAVIKYKKTGKFNYSSD